MVWCGVVRSGAERSGVGRSGWCGVVVCVCVCVGVCGVWVWGGRRRRGEDGGEEGGKGDLSTKRV